MIISFKQFLLLESQLQDWHKYISSNPMLKAAVEVLNILSKYGKAYIVGGAVRDVVLGQDPHDIDIATNVPMEKVEELFKSYDIGKAKSFGLLTIEHNGFHFEVAQFRKDSYMRPKTVRKILER